LASIGRGLDLVAVNRQGAWASIPPSRDRKEPTGISSSLYRACNLVERFFNKIKKCRRIATRDDKPAANCLAFVRLASIRLWLRAYEPTPWRLIHVPRRFDLRGSGASAPPAAPGRSGCRLQDGPEGFAYETRVEEGKPVVVIHEGPAGRRLIRGMRRAIRAMAEEGNDLILDDVLMGEARADYEAVLAGLTVHWVGVTAPLEVLEERERARGDRLIGTSRWQIDRVHAGQRYDLEVDTARMTAMECAEAIMRRFGL